MPLHIMHVLSNVVMRWAKNNILRILFAHAKFVRTNSLIIGIIGTRRVRLHVAIPDIIFIIIIILIRRNDHPQLRIDHPPQIIGRHRAIKSLPLAVQRHDILPPQVSEDKSSVGYLLGQALVQRIVYASLLLGGEEAHPCGGRDAHGGVRMEFRWDYYGRVVEKREHVMRHVSDIERLLRLVLGVVAVVTAAVVVRGWRCKCGEGGPCFGRSTT
mmetsp:Transcript_10883/g.26849  ORF Transcript_10883/g.26849 Transcript_10883/m.26849 type:complete len:214 (-) Transcript_10883:31-672(-)